MIPVDSSTRHCFFFVFVLEQTGQVISTRVDLFPEAYTSKLQELQDGLEPMPFEIVEKVVMQELLDGAPLSELFATFDEEPLGKISPFSNTILWNTSIIEPLIL